MDCCNNDFLEREKKGGSKKMNSKMKLWIVIGVLFVIAMFLTFKAGAVGSGTVKAVSNAASSTSSYSGMVGGC